MSAVAGGVLAVWNDRDERIAEFYEDWYVGQHLPERVGLPGWRYGRRYELSAPTGEPRFFTWYALDTPAAAASPQYLARLDAPTPETERVMRHWRNMTRTVCEVAAVSGSLSGAHAVVVRYDALAEPDALAALAGTAGAEAGVMRAAAWRSTHAAAGGASVEAGIRAAPDDQVAAALLVEFMRAADAAGWLERHRATLAGPGPLAGAAACYALLCEYRGK